MQETMHLFRKDSRAFWPHVLLLWSWLGCFVYASVLLLPAIGLGLDLGDVRAVGDWAGGFAVLVYGYSPIVLGFGAGYLLVQVIHADRPHGDRQFWLTRPYRRSRLLASKLLFAVGYVCLPLAVAQLSIVVLSGAPLSPFLPGLIWSQVLILALIVGPVFALASMSASTPWLVASLVPLAVVLAALLGDVDRLRGLDWIRLSALAILAQVIVVTVLWTQYRHRRTGRARTVALVGVVLAFVVSRGIDWDVAFALQQRVHGGSVGPRSASLAPPVFPAESSSPAGEQPSVIFEAGPGGVLVPLRLVLDSIAADTLVACEASRVTLTAESGARLSGPVMASDQRLRPARDGCPAYVTIPRAAQQFHSGRVTVDAELFITEFGEAQHAVLPLSERRVVPDLGECLAAPRSTLMAGGDLRRSVDVRCISPFRLPSVAVAIGSSNTLWPVRPPYFPWPAALGLQPIVRVGRGLVTDDTAISVWTYGVRGHVRLVVRAEDVDLRAHAARPLG